MITFCIFCVVSALLFSFLHREMFTPLTVRYVPVDFVQKVGPNLYLHRYGEEGGVYGVASKQMRKMYFHDIYLQEHRPTDLQWKEPLGLTVFIMSIIFGLYVRLEAFKSS